MAKETKTERKVRENYECEVRINDERREYLPKFMALLERATKLNFAVEVKDGKFVVTDRDDYYDSAHYLTADYSEESQNKLDNLAYYVDDKQKKQDEENRKFQLKQNALNKLSKEERELLGLV